MITGVISADREAVISVIVRNHSGQRRKIEAAIDTGFNGWLSLPPALISELKLPWRRRGLAWLADGSESIFDIYEANFLWDGRARRIPIDETNSAPLVGMALLDGFELRMRVRTGGKVTIKAL